MSEKIEEMLIEVKGQSKRKGDGCAIFMGKMTEESIAKLNQWAKEKAEKCVPKKVTIILNANYECGYNDAINDIQSNQSKEFGGGENGKR